MTAALSRIWTRDSGLLAPLGWPWALGATLHRLLYRSGLLRRERVAVPVVSVGNLVVGGAGKTPVTFELARRLLSAGRKVAVASRGYGRASKGLVIVSDGEAVRATAHEGGDEPVWLARRLPGLIVTVCEKRFEAAQAAIELGADLVLLDDGFSHHALERDSDVLVVDADWKLGNGFTLPAGPLREPASQMKRASLVWLTRCTRDDEPFDSRGLPLVRSRYEPSALVDLDLRETRPVSELSGLRVLGVCGIARPQGFERALKALGANVREVLAFADHHRFDAADVAQIASLARSERVELVVTTEKDAVRLSTLVPSDLPMQALRMDVRLIGEVAALDAFVRRWAPAWKGEAA